MGGRVAGGAVEMEKKRVSRAMGLGEAVLGLI